LGLSTPVVLILVLWSFSLACSQSKNQGTLNMAAAREAKSERKSLRDSIKHIEPYFVPMSKPANYDWLASHNEPGQTFDEYLASNPSKPAENRDAIYILPLGTFNSEQRKLIQTTSEFLEAFYDLPVKHMKTRSLSAIPSNSRKNRFSNKRQFKTGPILEDILAPSLPKDAAALIALTREDLYSDDSTNYVFGQASFDKGVGVWSLDRLDDNTSLSNYLLRTLKIAAHETGHMFSLRHCTKYECLMSGTNHLGETDRRPLDACPECTAKICWLSEISLAERYRRLIAFCRKVGLDNEGSDFEAKLKALNVNN
jgi:archaemetzincin